MFHFIKMTFVIITCFIFFFSFGEEQYEKIIFIRHGEKLKDSSLGQLNCQGLNRALQLPKILTEKFGNPDYIFAPNPAYHEGKEKFKYSYVRPLATIEPTAIKLEMPVNTQFGYNEVERFVTELINPKYEKKLIFIAWEHKRIVDIAKKIFLKDKNNKENYIPNWEDNDFDSIYIFTIKKLKNDYKIEFKKDLQGLENLSTQCP